MQLQLHPVRFCVPPGTLNSCGLWAHWNGSKASPAAVQRRAACCRGIPLRCLASSMQLLAAWSCSVVLCSLLRRSCLHFSLALAVPCWHALLSGQYTAAGSALLPAVGRYRGRHRLLQAQAHEAQGQHGRCHAGACGEWTEKGDAISRAKLNERASWHDRPASLMCVPSCPSQAPQRLCCAVPAAASKQACMAHSHTMPHGLVRKLCIGPWDGLHLCAQVHVPWWGSGHVVMRDPEQHSTWWAGYCLAKPLACPCSAGPAGETRSPHTDQPVAATEGGSNGCAARRAVVLSVGNDNEETEAVMDLALSSACKVVT
jgi:hypothetical protein